MGKSGFKVLFCILALLASSLLSAEPKAMDSEGMSGVIVGNEDDFLGAIAPDTSIYLDAHFGQSYLFSDAYPDSISEFCSFEDVYDGKQLVIHDVSNLSLYGDPITRTTLLSAHSYAYVILFRNCENITIESLDCGHSVEGYCTGGVLGFENCGGVTVNNCDLWGCGTEGITVWESTGIECLYTTIRDCSYSIMSVYDSSDIRFQYCLMRNNREFDQMTFVNSNKVRFDNCVIWDNTAGSYYSEGYLIKTSNAGIALSECAIFNNNVSALCNEEEDISLSNCTVFNNRVQYNYYED